MARLIRFEIDGDAEEALVNLCRVLEEGDGVWWNEKQIIEYALLIAEPSIVKHVEWKRERNGNQP